MKPPSCHPSILLTTIVLIHLVMAKIIWSKSLLITTSDKCRVQCLLFLSYCNCPGRSECILKRHSATSCQRSNYWDKVPKGIWISPGISLWEKEKSEALMPAKQEACLRGKGFIQCRPPYRRCWSWDNDTKRWTGPYFVQGCLVITLCLALNFMSGRWKWTEGRCCGGLVTGPHAS